MYENNKIIVTIIKCTLGVYMISLKKSGKNKINKYINIYYYNLIVSN